VTNGLASGTKLIKDIQTDKNTFTIYGDIVEFNGMMYFVGYSEEYGAELWKSDGTEAGTIMVKDINNGAAFSFHGTPTTTEMVIDIRSGEKGSYIDNLRIFNNKLLFNATDDNNAKLWISDGTDVGTEEIAWVWPY